MATRYFCDGCAEDIIGKENFAKWQARHAEAVAKRAARLAQRKEAMK